MFYLLDEAYIDPNQAGTVADGSSVDPCLTGTGELKENSGKIIMLFALHGTKWDDQSVIYVAADF